MQYLINGFATHQPILLETLKITTGNVLELGCGDGSTNLIKNNISNDRKLVSIESNREWADKFDGVIFLDAGNEDTVETGQKWVDCISSLDEEFELAFIDQSPWAARIATFHYLKDKVKYLIIHDIDYFPRNSRLGKLISTISSNGYTLYDMDFPEIKYHRVYYPPVENFCGPTGPPTLLCSNFTDYFPEVMQYYV